MCVNMHQGVIRPYLQGDACYDIQGVDDIAQGFAHLASVGVPHHGVQINLEERERGENVRPHILLLAHTFIQSDFHRREEPFTVAVNTALHPSHCL